MATDSNYVAFVVDQAGLGDRFVARKMFGEYGFHLDGKFVAMACDNTFFLKETAAIGKHGLELEAAPPYPGAKPYPVAGDLLEDPALLRQVLIDTAALLPEPKKSKAARTPRDSTR